MTNDQLVDIALELLESGQDMSGVCLKCGEEQDGVETDARGYECDSCGKRAVMGADLVVIALGDF